MINLSNTLKKKNNKKGFTLIELIVVIAILGILAAIAIPRFSGIQNQAKIDADAATAKSIVSSARIWDAQNNKTGEATIDNVKTLMTVPTPATTGTFAIAYVAEAGGVPGHYTVTFGPAGSLYTYNENTAAVTP